MSDDVAVIILAAGGSSRLGRPKQLLPFRGNTLLEHAARTALEARLGPVWVVLGAAAEDCERALNGLTVRVLHNPEWSRGIGTSIRAGIRAAIDARVSAALLMLSDQPLIASDHLRDLVSTWRNSGTVAAAASYGDSSGVPAVFSRSEFAALAALADSNGAKSHLATLGERVALLRLPQAATDVDTPADADSLPDL